MSHGKHKGKDDFDAVSTASNYNIVLNSTSFTLISSGSAKRHYICISNTNNAVNVYIVLCSLANAMNETGILLTGDNFGFNAWQMPPNAVYKGEICGISVSGNPTVSVCEF